jgi:FdhE protein
MVSNETDQQEREIRDSILRIKEDIPQIAGVVDAFEELFVKRSLAKSKLPAPSLELANFDTARFSQGAPILDDRKIELDRDSLLQVANLIIPALEKGFSKLLDPLERLKSLLGRDQTFMDRLLTALESTNRIIIEEMASQVEMEPETLQFVCSELTKPFAEKAEETVRALIKDLAWSKGYCPVCGGWPGVSFWKGQEGRRFLDCSVCGHEWSFMRTKCPFCENDDNSQMELVFSEDRKFEHAELCHVCKRYIVGLDTRDMITTPHRSVAPLGLIYLDFLVQERGFLPGAALGWNVLDIT